MEFLFYYFCSIQTACLTVHRFVTIRLVTMFSFLVSFFFGGGSEGAGSWNDHGTACGLKLVVNIKTTHKIHNKWLATTTKEINLGPTPVFLRECG